MGSSSDNSLWSKSINAAHNGNKVISYHPLPNITDLIARLHNCKILSYLDLRSGYHHIRLTPKGKTKNSFCNYYWKLALECSSIQNLLSIRCVLLPNVTIISSASCKEHLQHWGTIFSCLQAANLKIELSKCQLSGNIYITWDIYSQSKACSHYQIK